MRECGINHECWVYEDIPIVAQVRSQRVECYVTTGFREFGFLVVESRSLVLAFRAVERDPLRRLLGARAAHELPVVEHRAADEALCCHQRHGGAGTQHLLADASRDRHYNQCVPIGALLAVDGCYATQKQAQGEAD